MDFDSSTFAPKKQTASELLASFSPSKIRRLPSNKVQASPTNAPASISNLPDSDAIVVGAPTSLDSEQNSERPQLDDHTAGFIDQSTNSVFGQAFRPVSTPISLLPGDADPLPETLQTTSEIHSPESPFTSGDDGGHNDVKSTSESSSQTTGGIEPQTIETPRTLRPRNASLSYDVRANGGKKRKPSKNVNQPQASSKGNLSANNSEDSSQKSQWLQDRFLVAKREAFLPFLPEKNYITNLVAKKGFHEHAQEMAEWISLRDQPRGLTVDLKPYQLTGLSFVDWLRRNGVAGILGDEMGLGKTIQALALLQHLKETEQEHGPITKSNLVIAPLSVLQTWMSEAARFVPSLFVVRFHGTTAEKEEVKDRFRFKQAKDRGLSIPDLVITTYEAYASEHSWFKHRSKWVYVILDEGHKIKSSESQISRRLSGLRSDYKLILSGTPLQNDLKELWSLLHFLFPNVFTPKTMDSFQSAFDLSRGQVDQSFVRDVGRLLELIMLRRTKSSPGVNLGLPPKTERFLFVPLTAFQRAWYRNIITRCGESGFAKKVNGASSQDNYLASASVGQGRENQGTEGMVARDSTSLERRNATSPGEWKRLMSLLMQLRKVCGHPFLFADACPESPATKHEILSASGKFVVLNIIVKKVVLSDNQKLLVFSQFTGVLDLAEELLKLLGGDGTNFRVLRFDGNTTRPKRNLAVRLFQDLNSPYKVLLISMRAGGLGLTLHAAKNVVILDEDFNPQVTLQAEARAHRIGQKEEMTIYKLCTQGTVEEQMIGRVRKKLYLSETVADSMQNAFATTVPPKEGDASDGATPISTSFLRSMIRLGARSLGREQHTDNEILSWNFETMIHECEAKETTKMDVEDDDEIDPEDAEEWLSQVEHVKCNILEGSSYERYASPEQNPQKSLSRLDRRIGKETTVMVDGFAVSKASFGCHDGEAVATTSGKSAAPKKHPYSLEFVHQKHCQICSVDGASLQCSSCPRAYHTTCFKDKPEIKVTKLCYCPQHRCRGCTSSTADAGGMLFRCRTCSNALCEECVEWDGIRLIGEELPELKALGYEENDAAFWIYCELCVGKTGPSIPTDKSKLQSPIPFDQKHRMGTPDTAPPSELLTPIPSLTSSWSSVSPSSPTTPHLNENLFLESPLKRKSIDNDNDNDNNNDYNESKRIMRIPFRAGTISE